MEYIKVFWVSPDPDDPVLYYEEVDKQRNEFRRIEIRQDGSALWGSPESDDGTEFLSAGLPIPSIDEISSDDEFFAFSITKEEFETVWKKVSSR